MHHAKKKKKKKKTKLGISRSVSALFPEQSKTVLFQCQTWREREKREGGGEKERREGGESKEEGGGDWRREGEEEKERQ